MRCPGIVTSRDNINSMQLDAVFKVVIRCGFGERQIKRDVASRSHVPVEGNLIRLTLDRIEFNRVWKCVERNRQTVRRGQRIYRRARVGGEYRIKNGRRILVNFVSASGGRTGPTDRYNSNSPT